MGIMYRKNLLMFIFLFSFILCLLTSVGYAEKLIIADFNRGQKPNLISGDFGAWNKSEWDRSYFSIESFTSDPDIVYGGKGCSLQLDYDVDSKSGGAAYNGFWMRLEKIDLTKYDEMIFYIKGDKEFGYTSEVKVEIESIAGDIARFNISGIDENWQKMVLPLYQIREDGDFTEGYEINIVFEDKVATEKEGRLYIDQIYVQ